MLANLDAATPEADIRPAPPEPEADVFELTDEMALPDPAPPAPAASFSKIEPEDDIEFSEANAQRRRSRPMSRRSRALRRRTQCYRIRPSPLWNPPSIRWPIPC